MYDAEVCPFDRDTIEVLIAIYIISIIEKFPIDIDHYDGMMDFSTMVELLKQPIAIFSEQDLFNYFYLKKSGLKKIEEEIISVVLDFLYERDYIEEGSIPIESSMELEYYRLTFEAYYWAYIFYDIKLEEQGEFTSNIKISYEDDEE